MPELSIATGYGVALVSLAAIDPQPKADPVAPVKRNYAVSGRIQEQGLFCVWRWEVLEADEDHLTLLTQIGLHNAESSEVTIYTPNQRLVWTRYNALATYPEPMVDLRRDLWPAAIAVYFTQLEALA